MNAIRTALCALVSARTWRAVLHTLTDLPVGVASFTVIITLLSLSIGLIPAFLIGLPLLWVTLMAVRWFGRFERGRFAALLDLHLPPAPTKRPAKPGMWSRFWADLGSGATWREAGYGLLLLPWGAVALAVVTGVWSAGLAGTVLPAYAWAMPDTAAAPHGGLFWVYWAAGIVALLAAPWVTRGVAAVDATLGRSLLSTQSTEVLAERVETLTRSRADAVDAADAERRRIERDLHDGAQQRLVSVAMTLGMARAKMDSDPDAARELVAGAHEDAKVALAELRDLVRGIHPQILTDQGLDAAVSALAARCPVHVLVDVSVDPRPPGTIEAVAYFVVAEALTNVTRHAEATHARVDIRRLGDWFIVAVTDDGVGGATPRPGSGLAGLAGRVAAVDGSMAITSPPGGPTRLEVTLPCAR